MKDVFQSIRSFTEYFTMRGALAAVSLIFLLSFISCQSQSVRSDASHQNDQMTHIKVDMVEDRSMTNDEIVSHILLIQELTDKGYREDAAEVAMKLAHESGLSWQHLYHVSKALFSAGLYDQVVQVLEKAPDVTQHSPPLLLQLCAAYYQFGFFKEGWLSCGKAVKLANEVMMPEKSPMYYLQMLLYKAKVAYQLQKDDDLIETVNEMLDRHPEFCEAHYLLSKHFYRRSNIQKSLNQLDKMNPTCQEKYPQSHLLVVLGLVKSKKQQKAIDEIDRLIGLINNDQLVVDLKRIRSRIDVAKNTEDK